ncbi:putative protein N(5)-glutamine methyltransferase [Nocardioides marinquilinus]|uniref:peptide chain release factor N(5)-glutamine methyltransferase n=1 Tax=Nocardioides marinquilinus TaxID=1210400 RepID=A0ABP9PKJ2_9ACTN
MSEDDGLVARLRAAGCVYAEDEAALLREAAAGAPDPDAELERLVVARAAGRPLEHVLGWAELDGHRFAVDDGVFVPRRRSTLLVDLAESAAPEGATVLDLCCGSGALGAALAARRPDVVVHAADLDPAAVACARRNLPAERVHEGDLFDALPADLRGRIDVVVLNAPYVPHDELVTMPAEARDHEHHLSLDGGSDGLDVHRRVAAAASDWLAPGGLLVTEAAPVQIPTLCALLEDAGLAAEPVEEPRYDATGVAAISPTPRRRPRRR